VTEDLVTGSCFVQL